MTMRTRLILAALAAVCLIGLIGCGSGDGNNNNNPGGNTGTVTGRIVTAQGGAIVPLGGQTVSIGNIQTTSDATTGVFTLVGVPAGNFTIVVTATAGFPPDVLNAGKLTGVVLAGGTTDVQDIIMGFLPPPP